jgi:endonuclease YncB( thermonuclease family)
MGTVHHLRRWQPPEGDWKRHSRSAQSRSVRFIGFVLFAGFLASAALLSDRWSGTPANAARTPVSISVTAIDGDSLRSGKEDIRLLGIDAVELYQTCRDDRGRDWACGREAHAKLRALVGNGSVNCTASSRDRFGRTLAKCSAGDVADVSEAMVRAGYAVNFMGGSYASAEAEARAAKRGIWRGSFDRPQDWRDKHPRPPHG